MDTVIPGSEKGVVSAGKRRKTFRVIAVCLIAALIAGGVFIYIRTKQADAGTAVEQRTSTVVKGRLVKSIAGSAPVVSSSRSELSPKVTATLQQINCKEGDQVKAGDVLFVLDNTDALLDIENAKNSIEQMQLTIDSTYSSIKGLTVMAPYLGQVTDISVKEGDNINKDGALMTLTDVSKLSVTLPFNSTAVEKVQPGQMAVVYIPELLISVEGNVTYMSSKPYLSESGSAVYNIEITVDNPGSLSEGMQVTAEITAGDTVTDSAGSDTLAYVRKKVIRSEAGGTIAKLNVRENESVDAGDVLVKLENDDLILTSSTNAIKFENLKSQLEIKQKQLDYYTIKAPFDGTITSMGNTSEGDTVKQGEMLAVVSDMSRLEFSIDIDELDISQIVEGQSVEITAEALEDTQSDPLTGKVSNVAMEGSSQNGVTTYPVTVSVDDNAAGKLKTGMNIDAEIYISDKQDVLMVPVEAITKIGNKSFVYVNATGGSAQKSNMENPSAGRPNAGENGSPGSRPVRPGSSQDTDTNSSKGSAVSDPATGSNTIPKAPDSTGNGSQEDGNAVGGQASTSQSTSGRRQGMGKGMGAGTDSYYDGYTMVEVETGISNDTYIEITSGLSEGQKVLLPKTAASSSSTTDERGSQQDRGGDMMGGGGMPMGGMMGGGKGF